MPWMELNIVILRKQFVEEYLDKNYPSFSYLCASYNISTKTGYKWLDRFRSTVLVVKNVPSANIVRRSFLTDSTMDSSELTVLLFKTDNSII